jgi:O-antigen/teichoic acid export membrane protein
MAVPSDQRIILGNTGQNVLGLGIGAIALFAAQVLMTNALGDQAFGVVTLTTQFAFIAAAATRFGMDVADVRLVAILIGREQAGRAKGLVTRSVLIAAAVSIPFAAIVYVLAGPLADAFSALPGIAEPAFRAAALAIPLAALAFSKSAAMTTLAFGLSWALALAIAWRGWTVRSRPLAGGTDRDGIPEEHTRALIRFGALRAPATLFSQLIFWADFFVLSILSSSQGAQGASSVGIYGAVLRAAQALFLFLTSVSLTFSPFVADLHHRGEREQLDSLYKSVTRWTLAATIPVLLVLAILPGPVLRIFGGDFVEGEDALRILIIGMIVPVMVGTVGFILIMAGRTGWDLLVYVGSFALDIGIALALARPEVLGIRGAAIAQAVTLTMSALARLFLVRRFLGIWPFDEWYLRLVVPTLAGGLAMWATHAALPPEKWLVDLVISAGIGCAVYAVTLVAVGLKPGERGTVLRMAHIGR